MENKNKLKKPHCDYIQCGHAERKLLKRGIFILFLRCKFWRSKWPNFIIYYLKAEMESSRTHFDVLGLEGQVLDLEASSTV